MSGRVLEDGLEERDGLGQRILGRVLTAGRQRRTFEVVGSGQGSTPEEIGWIPFDPGVEDLAGGGGGLE